MKKAFVIALLSAVSIQSFSQNNASDTSVLSSAEEEKVLHRHRIYINPGLIATGQYSLTYGFRFYRNNWIEVSGGYRYIPVSIVKALPGAPQNKLFELFANPEYGLGFTGPVANVAFIHYYKGKKFNGICFDLFYHQFDHPADCYYEPSDFSNDIHYTYTSSKKSYGGKLLLLYTTTKHHFIYEGYVGAGVHVASGETIKYVKQHAPCYGCTYPCVPAVDIHDANVTGIKQDFHYEKVSPQIGIRFGFQ